VSYVNVPPAYYQANQPNTPWEAGAPGWWSAQVPGWGENPNAAWARMQAANGLGAEPAAPPCTPPVCQPPPAPRFTYEGSVPQDHYLRLAVAPWGAFPHGPGYQSPRSTCTECEGFPVSTSIGSLVSASRAMQRGDFTAAARQAVTGLGCGPCEISPGCQTCPNGSDLPECSGCVDGQPPVEKRSIFDHPLAGPVIVGAVGALVTGVVLYAAKKMHAPVA